MKRILIIFYILALSHIAPAQGCLSEGITFSTQAQIDNFKTNYPGCSEIWGSVTINGGNNINNLAGLNLLTSIGGSLLINSNSALQNLTGLSMLTSIGGDLSINNCSALQNLSGMLNLVWVGGSFIIGQNQALTSLAACSNLQTVEGSLEITFNPVLTSLTGLDQLAAGSLSDLVIHDNSALSSCDVESVCVYLGNPIGHVDIYNNAQGCSKPPEIANACGFTLSCLPYGDYYLLSQEDVDNFKVDYADCTDMNGIVKISGNNITNLIGLNDITTVGSYLTIVQNPALTSLAGLESLHTVSGAVSIGFNPLLTSLTGMENLVSLDGYLSVYNNNELTSLAGLENLTSIGDMLEIMSNEKLTGLTALSNLSSIGNSLWIRNNNNLTSLSGLDQLNSSSITSLVIAFNSQLTTCEVESICDYLASPGGSVNIENNAPGCNSPWEVEDACEEVGVEDRTLNRNLRIYPSPANNSIFIETPETSGNKQLEIVDASGQQVMFKTITGKSGWIDIGSLPKGFYIIKIIGENKLLAGKFAKE